MVMKGWYFGFRIEEKKLVWVIARKFKLGLQTYLCFRVGSKKLSKNVFSVYNLEIVMASGRILGGVGWGGVEWGGVGWVGKGT